jgi:uncharacterized protein (TIGR03435 family)
VFDMQGTAEELLTEMSRSKKINVHGVKLPGGRYHVTLTGQQPEFFGRLSKAFEEAFKLRVVEERREVDGWKLEADLKVLKGLPRPEARKEDGEGFGRMGRNWDGAVRAEVPKDGFVDGTMKELADTIGNQLKVPVVDGTHTMAEYRVKLEFDKNKPLEGINKSLSGQGLKLVAIKTPVRAVHVEAPGAGSSPAGK